MEKTSKLHTLVIRENQLVPRTMALAALGWGPVLAGSVWMGIQEDRPEMVGISVFLLGIAFLIHLYFLLKHWFWRVTLSPYGCWWRNRFGIRKEFQLQDVKRIRKRKRYRSRMGYEYMDLLDQNEKVIVTISVMTSENVRWIVPFFKANSTEVVVDEYGRVGLGKRTLHIEEYVDPASERQISRWKAHQKEWEKRPSFYQNPKWMNRIRNMGFCLYGLMAVGMLAGQMLPAWAAAVVYGIVPLLSILYFLTFCRVLVWKTPRQTTREWEHGHVVMSDFTPAMLLFFFWSPLMDLNFAFADLFLCSAGLFVLLLIPVMVHLIRQRLARRLPWLMVSLLLYACVGTHCWNYLLTPPQDPVQCRFTVLEKQELEFVKFTQYRLRVFAPEEGEILFRVCHDTWQKVREQERVTFCIEKSLLGIRYCHIQL